MAKASSDKILTYGDIQLQNEECAKRAEAAKERGFRQGEYEITYTVNGHTFTEKWIAFSTAEAIEHLKENCAAVNWYPTNIIAKTIVEPNAYC